MRTKKIIQILMASTLLITGCGKQKDDDKLQVSATLFPAYDFVREIAGDEVDVDLVLKPGTDLHSFDPTPKDIIKMQESDMFIYIGTEKWAETVIKGIDKDKTKVVRLMDYVKLDEELITEGMEHSHEEDHDHEHEDGDHDHEHDEHDHNDVDKDHMLEHENHDKENHEADNSDLHYDDLTHYDEHIWTSLVNAQILVENITENLIKIDGDNKKLYNDNMNNYTKKLESLDSIIKDTVENSVRDEIIVGDRFPFTYFVEDYDLEPYAAFTGCSSSTNASPQTISFLIDKMNTKKIPVVFYIELSNQKIADAIIEGTETEKLELNSAHNLTKEQYEDGITYLDFMENNYKNLKKALN